MNNHSTLVTNGYHTSKVVDHCKKMSLENSRNWDCFLSVVLDLVKEHKLIQGQYSRGDNPQEKVIEFVHPKPLGDKIGLDIVGEAASQNKLETICRKVIQYSVKTCHPTFYNQLYHAADEYGIAASWLSEVLNTNNHTFEVAPVFIVVERSLIQYFIRKFGYPEGDGIFSPGGSLSNMYGMVLARHRQFPEIKSKGLFNHPPLVAFTSEEAHYSIVKGANWLGLGTENVIKIKTNERGRMIPEELNKEIMRVKLEGKIPFFVNSTSGTTVMGSYDDLEAIDAVCKKYDIWHHVDACWGGAVVMSRKLRYKIKGIEKSDSISWNAHKMMGSPLQTSLFITRHNGLLHETNSASARYLFQQDKFYDVSYDTGDKSLQCGRKVDAFKLWFMIQARGENHLEKTVENAFEKAEYLDHLVRTTPGFRPAFNFEGLDCTNVSFIYIPERLRDEKEDDAWWDEISKIPPKVKEIMIKKGSMMVGYQPLPHKNKKNFFRMVIPALPMPTNEDMKFVIEEIDRCGKNL